MLSDDSISRVDDNGRYGNHVLHWSVLARSQTNNVTNNGRSGIMSHWHDCCVSMEIRWSGPFQTLVDRSRCTIDVLRALIYGVMWRIGRVWLSCVYRCVEVSKRRSVRWKLLLVRLLLCMCRIFPFQGSARITAHHLLPTEMMTVLSHRWRRWFELLHLGGRRFPHCSIFDIRDACGMHRY